MPVSAGVKTFFTRETNSYTFNWNGKVFSLIICFSDRFLIWKYLFCYSVEMIKQNLSLITNCVRNDNEEQLVDQLLENVFNNTSNHWENIELDRYRKDPNGYISFLQNCWNK